ncbi:3-hydroxyacyl-[acyl-carrier-protein] dehydratase FabZ [Candidatus Epulonipiscium fishelsonii]|uniref:3-hydroxyacyl-[acyl-carrier-protein] dehydratase FabZ n=1 Tax=Candidatus Epulonipiscium fishelsonii TaxID=77094 RepID=A0ACC8XAT0_9FIRM|nr:3-hydroxyacyl-[acyl-carrier-protein] dehydratase FabZ [Epulopiscium sp. SCG-B11WGA-EpuloA1]ONI41987.1 3-hydroxyacyl-[acyl-carrier-protein] dehydratase FabZ [Epulopiscium sp. SCG-B05WGA-EpuloA1]ONI47214.1 3-hydroxyacyl-[acyl-carrier-protein] dehydratase FabZ [Epulopiscium sp. SCG-C06WGA-EpuloA1]
MLNTLNIEEIMKILPHRYPFLLVDKAEIDKDGKGAVGYKNVTINEPFFQGHFPIMPVMPGVLIVEAMAQVGAIALLNQEEYKGKIGFLAGIDKAKFKQKVVPGDVLKLECRMVKQKGPIGVAEAVASVNGKKVATAELKFAVGDANV